MPITPDMDGVEHVPSFVGMRLSPTVLATRPGLGTGQRAAGLPPPDANYPADAGDRHHTIAELAIALDVVQRNFAKYGLLDKHVKFLKGWFKHTLPRAPMEKLALIRLDGDLYESTWVALESLYPKLARGGYLIVDDYGAGRGLV